MSAVVLASFARKRQVLPGFGLAMGFTLSYLSLLVLIPLAGLFLRSAGLGWHGWWNAIASPRVLAALRLSFGGALAAAAINAVFGSFVAFVYAVLMQFNIVYTLFFAVCIVCGFRGLGHWGAYWMKQRRSAGVGPTGASVNGSGTGAVPVTVASNGAGGKVAAGETVTT